MEAIETTATINDQGQLSLARPSEVPQNRQVRVIVLIPEDGEVDISEEESEVDLDDTPTEVVLEGLRQGLEEALMGQTIPLTEMWEGIDVD